MVGGIGRVVVPRVRRRVGDARRLVTARARAASRTGARGPGPGAVYRTRNLNPRRGYSPVKRGSRFSMNAIIASAVSRDENIKACATFSDSIASAIVWLNVSFS